MPDNPAVSLRPATAQDRFLIRRLLASPGAQETWGNTASAEAEITLAMESSAALTRMIVCNGEAIGYAQAVDTGVLSERLHDGVPAGAWRVAYFHKTVAGLDDVSCGLAVLTLITDEVFSTSLAIACSAEVSIRTETATRAYERAGFRWLRVAHDPSVGPLWVMLKDRPAKMPAR
jgi:hypothetical protein